MITDNQLAKGIQSEKHRELGAKPPVGGVGGEATHEPGDLGGQSLPNIKKNLNSSESQTNSLSMLSTKLLNIDSDFILC